MTDGFLYDYLETIWSDSLSESLSSRIAINSFCGSRQRTVVACNSCCKAWLSFFVAASLARYSRYLYFANSACSSKFL